MRYLQTGWAILLTIAVCLTGGLRGQTVQQLGKPKDYVNDYANVLSAQTRQQLNMLCGQMDHRANAQIFTAIIKQLPEDEDIDGFASKLEESWKAGRKGSDRGVLVVLAVQDRKYRIEVGYGLEPILNDAKVGDIGRAMVPYLRQQNYDQAVTVAISSLAKVIADDAHVQLDPQWQYFGVAQRRQQQSKPLTPGQVITAIIAIAVILFILVRFGGSGLVGFLLGMFFGGGFGGGGRGGGWGGGDGGGFGGGGGDGFGGGGGGSSGGGGASGGW